MILDEQLPEWHVRERHSVRIAVAPADALAAARAVTANELPVLLVLMGLRSLPAAIARRSRRRVGAPLLDDFTRMGFAPLADSPEELVYGGVGRFWQPSGGLMRVPAGEFAGFAEPGYAKIAWTLEAEPLGPASSRFRTETRVSTTDPRSRRLFRRYWAVLSPGILLIRRESLKLVKAEAERRFHASTSVPVIC